MREYIESAGHETYLGGREYLWFEKLWRYRMCASNSDKQKN